MDKIKHHDTYLTIDGVKHLYLIFTSVSGMPVDKNTYDEHTGFKTCKPANGEIDPGQIKRNSILKPRHPFIPA